MVQKWCGGMNGFRLVLLFGIQVSLVRFGHAENLPYTSDVENTFQVFKPSKIKDAIDYNGLLVYEDSNVLENDISDPEDTEFVDAQWTAQPKIGNFKGYKNYNQNFRTKTSNISKIENGNPKYIYTEEKSGNVNVEGGPVDNMDIAETTPMYTEPMTTEMDGTPYVTETVTQPITTEVEYDDTTDEDEMLRRMHRRWRRAALVVTGTTTDSATTSVPPQNCQGQSYYNSQTGTCNCPAGRTGTNCETDMTAAEEEAQAQATNTYSGRATGVYDNSDRATFENELTSQFSNRTGFLRIHVHEITYNATTGFSTITFDVMYDAPVSPDQTSQASSTVSDVTSNRTPVNVNSQQVLWAVEATLTVTDDDGTVNSIPVSVNRTTIICYIYDKLKACKNGGLCVNSTGSPVCSCTSDYHGRYCEALIRRLDTTETSTLAILLPVLAGACGLVFLCTCCFALARRVNRGEGEEASSASSIPRSALAVPKLFFHDTNWKHFDPGPRLVVEEIVEEQPVIEYHREVLERDFEEDHIVREPIYRYYLDEEKSQTFFVSSSSSDTSSSPGSWVNEASRIGSHFHIDRPEYESSANDAYS